MKPQKGAKITKNKIIIHPISDPRRDWDNAFKTMADKGDDALINGEENFSHSWDDEEWQW